jgi:coenzyme Q-binding protein COQ10
VPRLSEQILVGHDADQLYELVRDIRTYPDFIKWVQKMQVFNETEDGDLYRCVGEVEVTFKGFDETFSTHVRANRASRRIDVELDRGPFRHLRNRWQFDPRGEQRTRVHFFIDYEFSNPVLSLLARTNMRRAVDRIMQAFRSEADRRYGPAIRSAP